MRGLARSLFKLELFVCFAPCTLILTFGALILPHELVQAIGNPLATEPALLIVLAVIFGTIGLCALLYLVSVLLAGKERIEHAGRVLAGVLLGVAPLITLLISVLATAGDRQPGWELLIPLVALPLLATVHILYLSRHILIASLARS